MSHVKKVGLPFREAGRPEALVEKRREFRVGRDGSVEVLRKTAESPVVRCPSVALPTRSCCSVSSHVRFDRNPENLIVQMESDMTVLQHQ